VARPQGGRLSAVFYPFGHPTQNAYVRGVKGSALAISYGQVIISNAGFYWTLGFAFRALGLRLWGFGASALATVVQMEFFHQLNQWNIAYWDIMGP
jgi:hypothetical protein